MAGEKYLSLREKANPVGQLGVVNLFFALIEKKTPKQAIGAFCEHTDANCDT